MSKPIRTKYDRRKKEGCTYKMKKNKKRELYVKKRGSRRRDICTTGEDVGEELYVTKGGKTKREVGYMVTSVLAECLPGYWSECCVRHKVEATSKLESRCDSTGRGKSNQTRS